MWDFAGYTWWSLLSLSLRNYIVVKKLVKRRYGEKLAYYYLMADELEIKKTKNYSSTIK